MTGVQTCALPICRVESPPIFGWPIPRRDTDCEREPRIEQILPGVLHWFKSEEVNARVNSPKNRVGRLLQTKLNDMEVLDELCLAILSRLPREQERMAVTKHLERNQERRGDAWNDVMWALINSREIVMRH